MELLCACNLDVMCLCGDRPIVILLRWLKVHKGTHYHLVSAQDDIPRGVSRGPGILSLTAWATVSHAWCVLRVHGVSKAPVCAHLQGIVSGQEPVSRFHENTTENRTSSKHLQLGARGLGRARDEEGWWQELLLRWREPLRARIFSRFRAAPFAALLRPWDRDGVETVRGQCPLCRSGAVPQSKAGRQ